MKKTQKILGLPIISISDGMEVGKVKSIIINAEKGAIDYIVVDSGIQIFSARVIPTENILGIGEYALTIENEGVITDISRIPAAINLLQKDIQVKGTKVLTKKGRLIGEIGDIYIDVDNLCTIAGLEFIADITQKKIKLIPRESVITFGKNLIVVKEDVEASLLDTPEQLASDDGAFEAEKKNMIEAGYLDPSAELKPYEAELETLYAEGGHNSPEAAADLYGTQELYAASEVAPAELPPLVEEAEEPTLTGQESSDRESNAAGLFEQRQRQYLNGRKAAKTIVDNYGNTIIAEGEVISDDIIDDAKRKGKLIELVMNNKA